MKKIVFTIVLAISLSLNAHADVLMVDVPYNGGLWSSSVQGGSFAAGQRFKSNYSFKLSTVAIYGKKKSNPPDDLTVQIQTDSSGEPSNTVIGTSNISTFTGALTWKNATFTIQPNITANEYYWVIVKCPTCTSSECYEYYGDLANTYDDGYVGWTSDGGTTWSTNTDWEKAAKIYSSSIIINLTCVSNTSKLEVFCNWTSAPSASYYVLQYNSNSVNASQQLNYRLNSSVLSYNTTYNLSVSAYDNSSQVIGNSSIVNVTTIADTTPPTQPLLHSPSPSDGIITSNTSFNFNWTVTDDLADTLTCNLTINSVVNQSVLTQNNVTTNKTVSGFTDGVYGWNITCWDEAGNGNASETRTFTVDTATPGIWDMYSSDSDNVTRNDTDLTFYVNWFENNTLNITLRNSTTLQMLWDNSMSEGEANLTTNPANLGCSIGGNCSLIAEIVDKAGYTNSTSYEIIIDNTEPGINITSPVSGGWYNGTITVIHNESDFNPGSVAYRHGNISGWSNLTPISWNLNFTFDTNSCPEGFNNCTLEINATDLAENSNLSNVTFSVDNSAPLISQVNLSDYYVGGTRTINITSDGYDPQGLKSCWYFFKYLNGTTINSSNISTDCDGTETIPANLSDGPYLVDIRAMNNVDMESWMNRTIYVDNTKPTILPLTENNTAINSNSGLRFKATDTISQNMSCVLQVSDYTDDWTATNNSVMNNTETTISLPANITDGSYNWFINCTDLANNTNWSESRTIIIDSTKPRIIINNPGANEVINNNIVEINFTVNGTGTEINLSSLTAIINGTIYYLANMSTSDNTTFIFNSTWLSEGAYLLEINATDLTGNTNSTTRNFSVILTMPACYTDSDCGGNGYIHEFCQDHDVYGTYRTYQCENPGTASAFCTSSDNTNLKEECGDSFCAYGDNYCLEDNAVMDTICYNRGCDIYTITCYWELALNVTETVETCAEGYVCSDGACVSGDTITTSTTTTISGTTTTSTTTTISGTTTTSTTSSTTSTSSTIITDIMPPSVTDLTIDPERARSKSDIMISAKITDQSLDMVKANITLPDSTPLLINLEYEDDLYIVIFTDTKQKGKYNVQIIANDTFGNINDTEFSDFRIYKPRRTTEDTTTSTLPTTTLLTTTSTLPTTTLPTTTSTLLTTIPTTTLPTTSSSTTTSTTTTTTIQAPPIIGYATAPPQEKIDLSLIALLLAALTLGYILYKKIKPRKKKKWSLSDV